VRLVQEARKSSGFDVSDRIVLVWQAEGETAEALRENGALVADEVLAVQMSEGEVTAPAEGGQVPAVGPDGAPTATVVHDAELRLTVSVARV
ncbi:MAG TPA: DUF5915 domain-containing protein, partial [Nocardioidaceae bacterium]